MPVSTLAAHKSLVQKRPMTPFSNSLQSPAGHSDKFAEEPKALSFAPCFKAFGTGILLGLVLLLLFPELGFTDASTQNGNLMTFFTASPSKDLPGPFATVRAQSDADILSSELEQGELDGGLGFDEVAHETIDHEPRPSARDESEQNQKKAFLRNVEIPNIPKPVPPPVVTPAPTAAPTEYACRVDTSKKFSSKVLSPEKAKLLAEKMKFFIAPEFDSTGLQRCAYSLMLSRPETSDGDITATDVLSMLREGKIVGLDESFEAVLADILVIEVLKNHANRVLELYDAEFVVLDILPQLSFSLPDPSILDYLPACSSNKIGSNLHEERMYQAFEKYMEIGYSNQEKPVFFPLGYPIGSKIAEKMLTKDFYNSILLKTKKSEFIEGGDIKSIVATSSDHSFSKFRKLATKRSIIIPHLLNRLSEVVEEEDMADPGTRRTTFFLDEVMIDDYKSIRQAFSGMSDVRPELQSVMSDVSVRSVQRSFISPAALRNQKMKDATFCFVIDGVDQRPEKNRLVDILAAGCIPVFVETQAPNSNGSPSKRIETSFPFSATIDYSKIGYFFSNLDCLQEHPLSSALELKQLRSLTDNDEGKAELKSKQLAGRDAMRRLIHINDEFSEALLTEIGHLIYA